MAKRFGKRGLYRNAGAEGGQLWGVLLSVWSCLLGSRHRQTLSIKMKVNQAGVEREEGMEEWEQGMPLLSATCFSRFKVGALLCN